MFTNDLYKKGLNISALKFVCIPKEQLRNLFTEYLSMKVRETKYMSPR